MRSGDPDRVYVRTEAASVLFADERAELVHAERPPRTRLRAYVETVEVGSERLRVPVTERLLPDGAVHLFFDVGDRPAATVSGATDRFTTLHLAGRIDQVGVRLRPGAIAAVLGAPAASVRGELPLEALWGRAAVELLERLATAPLEARPSIVESALEDRLASEERGPHRAVSRVAAQILAAHGNVRVGALADSVDLTERRLEQLFALEVGLSPRAFARIARFRRAAGLLAAGRPGAWVAEECGYYDHAHLIRDFRALAGATPRALDDFGFVQSRQSARD